MNLITGGTGLLGLHIAMDLYQKNLPVRILSRQNTWPKHVDSILEYYSIKPHEFKEKVDFKTGDVTDIISLEEAFENVHTVYHCAALVSFVKSEYSKMMNINVNGTTNVVNLCLAVGVKNLCHISSTSAIGKKGTEDIIVEDGDWVRELNASNYAKSKFLAEREAWRGQEEGLSVTIVNPSVILGPGNWDDSSAAIFKTGAKGIKYYTEGGNAFVDVRDVVFSISALMAKQIVGKRYLIIGHNTKFKVLFEKICKAFGSKAPRTKASRWMSSLAWRVEGILAWMGRRKPRITKETASAAHSFNKFSNEKIKNEIDIEFRSLDDTVEHTVSYFQGIKSK